jgi:hypothetical protein
MATQECSQCNTEYAGSKSFCPNCNKISKTTERYIDILNREIESLKIRVKAFRNKTFPCKECKSDVSLYSMLHIFYSESERENGMTGYFDGSGTVQIYTNYLTTKTLSCTYRDVCPHCKSEDPLNGKNRAFYVNLNRYVVSDAVVGLFKFSFVLAYRTFFALILSIVTLMIIYQGMGFNETTFIFSTIAFLFPVSYLDKKFKKRIIGLINYEKEIGDYYLRERKDFELMFGRINAASDFLPQKEAFRTDIRNRCFSYIHKYSEEIDIKIDLESKYLR